MRSVRLLREEIRVFSYHHDRVLVLSCLFWHTTHPGTIRVGQIDRRFVRKSPFLCVKFMLCEGPGGVGLSNYRAERLKHKKQLLATRTSNETKSLGHFVETNLC